MAKRTPPRQAHDKTPYTVLCQTRSETPVRPVKASANVHQEKKKANTADGKAKKKRPSGGGILDCSSDCLLPLYLPRGRLTITDASSPCKLRLFPFPLSSSAAACAQQERKTDKLLSSQHSSGYHKDTTGYLVLYAEPKKQKHTHTQIIHNARRKKTNYARKRVAKRVSSRRSEAVSAK